MKIGFADPAVGELCNNYNPSDAKDDLEKYVKKKSKGERDGGEVMRCLGALQSAENPSELPSMYNYHLLRYDLRNHASVDIYSRGKGKKGGRGKWRLIFKPISSCDDINNNKSIEKIIITELIIDDHKR